MGIICERMEAKLNMSLDELLAKDRESKKPQRRSNRDNQDVDMDDTGYGPTRRRQGRHSRKNTRDAGPVARYATSGNVHKAWTHDLFGKEDDEIERTGWGMRKNDRTELLPGTVVSVQNLHYEVTEEELKTAFTDNAGEVTAVKIKFDKTGRSTGNARVTFARRSDADLAVGLDGKQMKGQVINVSLYERPPKQGDRRRQNYNDNRGGRSRGRGDYNRQSDRDRRPKRDREVTFTVYADKPPSSFNKGY